MKSDKMKVTEVGIWRKVRIVLMILLFIEGLLTPFFAKESPFAGVPFIFQILLIILPLFICPLGLVFVMSIQSLNPFQNKPWTLPDWDSNFLNLKNPLHFFHAAAYFIAATGIGLTAASLFTDLSYLTEGLGMISGCAGVLFGINLCTKTCREKFQSISEPLQQKKSLKVVQYSKAIGVILILCVFITTVIAAVFLKNSLDFKRKALETEGIVVKNETRDSDDGTYYHPVFSFADSTGQAHEFCSSIGSSPPQYKIHDKILILYNPMNPEEARISSFWGLYAIPTVLGAGGMINVLAGMIFLFVVPAVITNGK